MFARIGTIALAVVALGFAAAAATYIRYESFDPCDWMVHDEARGSSLPRAVVRAHIQARFLLQGVRQPDAYQCLQAWWKFRADNIPKGS